MRITHVSALAAAFLALGTATAAAEPNAADSPRQAIARAYLDALVSHDASAVPFAPDATRVEVGLRTGYSGPQLSADLENGLQYRVIQGIRDLTMSESGDTVTTHYLLDSGVAGIRLTTVEITETFVIPVDSIQTIEATITPVL
ncbi:hypothetical protein [Nocardia fluminea]|uniref:DUF8021 domain-containing protein n=1 Tax=Nocardia fluminea TaxID=134984 RepID=A0A2N3V756_9NOCA|nr:hypothetical protein [Nocardia fluminea]PKV77452.1 hypothetical protein ATK86_1793 [Nocardia fluminea]